MKPLRIPRDLDGQINILLWEGDEFAVMAITLFISMFISSSFWALLAGIGAALLAGFIMRRVKEDISTEELLGCLYWWGVPMLFTPRYGRDRFFGGDG